MLKKKKSVRWAIQSLGLLKLAHPDIIEDTWRGRYVFGSGNTTPYGSAFIDTSGRIRISVAGENRLKAMKNSAIQAYRYETNTPFERREVVIMESVVETTFCYNLPFREILEGKIPTVERKVNLYDLDSNQPTEIISHITSAFREDFFHDIWSVSSSTYLCAFALLVVDDLSLFHEKAKYLDPKPLTDIDKCVTVYSVTDVIDDFLPHLQGTSGFPLQLLVIENNESIDWIEKGTIPKKKKNDYSKAIQVKDYLLHRYKMEIIDLQIRWINSRCKDLLETVPRDTPQTIVAREERLQQLIDASMNLDFYFISYLMAKDFIIREIEQEDITDSVSTMIPTKSGIQEKLNVLDENLTQLRQSLQTRVTLESLRVEKYKEEQQARTERGLGVLQLFFAAFVLLEIVAAYMAWFLDSTLFWNHPPWWVVIFGSVILMVYGVSRFSQKDESEDVARIFLKCPNCSAGYWYMKSEDSSEKSINCQNCAKDFMM